MKNDSLNQSYYPAVHEEDKKWGIIITSSGIQDIRPFEDYPPKGHPDTHFFNYHRGRVLDEYQMIYITQNRGFFTSDQAGDMDLKEGNLLMLFPGEWHSYYPKSETGWKVYWVGFKGFYARQLVDMSYFSPSDPVFKIGYNENVLMLYQQIIDHVKRERPGYQQLLGGLIAHMLGYLHHFRRDAVFTNKSVIPLINKAKLLMREQVNNNINAEEIARMLNMSYIWFRQSFREYTGFSPGQYLNQLKIQKAKELLAHTSEPVKQIAHSLGFESADYFSVFFKRYAGISPLSYRNLYRNKENY